MNDFSVLCFLQKCVACNLWRYLRQQSRFKNTVVTVFAICFWGSLFALFYRGFHFLYTYIPSDFSAMIIDYLFVMFYFTLFFMLTFSSTIIAFSVLFHARETDYLMTCPLSAVAIFFYKLAETSLFASWAVFFLGMPVCFAYAIHQELPLIFYPLLLLSFLPFIAIPSLLGGLVALIIGRYLVQWRRLLAILFLVAVAFGAVWWGYKLWRLEKETTVFTTAWLFGFLDYLNFARHPLMPSTWMSRGMAALAALDYGEFFFQFLALTATALFLSGIGYMMADSLYPSAWSKVHTTTGHKRFWKLGWLSRFIRAFFLLKPQDRYFLEKDIKTFLRDPLQWGQFAILLGLLLLYTLNLRTFKYDQQSIFWKHVVAILNLTATGLTICTFSSRFIFPLLSLEGKRFWTLGVMPIERRGILMAKFVFAVVALFITGETLILLSCYMLRLPWQLTLLHAMTMLAITFGVAGLSVGLGALYPNFKEDSPAKIVTGFGGTLNLVLNLIFVLIIIAIQMVPSHLVLKETIHAALLYLASAATLVVTVFTCVVPMYLGSRSFAQREI